MPVMYHPDASEPITVSEGSKANAEKRGWTEKRTLVNPVSSQKTQPETQRKKPTPADD